MLLKLVMMGLNNALVLADYSNETFALLQTTLSQK